MKKAVLILLTSILFFALVAFNYSSNKESKSNSVKVSTINNSMFEFDILNTLKNETDVEFVYNVQSRFNTTISKKEVLNAKNIIDLVPKNATENLTTYTNVIVTKVNWSGNEINIWGEDENLNDDQVALLNSLNYSEHFYINADCINTENGTVENYRLVYFLTIVPEKEAEYLAGNYALLNYLKDGSKKEISISKSEELKPGRINFTISPEGNIDFVTVSSTCNYKKIDTKMVDLIKNMPGKWKPATNENGEKVAQELVFFYGIEGC